METDGFVNWFKTNANALREKDPDSATNEILDELQKIDERLGAEVNETGEELTPRELILSASGDSELFEEVDALAQKIATEGWKIVSLKPERGFDFTVRTADDSPVDARTLYFEALESPSMPGVLGLRLFAKPDQVAALGETAWWILETGIGERACALIEHLEVAELPEDKGELMPIRALGSFVKWHTNRRQGGLKS